MIVAAALWLAGSAYTGRYADEWPEVAKNCGLAGARLDQVRGKRGAVTVVAPAGVRLDEDKLSCVRLWARERGLRIETAAAANPSGRPATAAMAQPLDAAGGWTLGDPATPTDNGSATVVQLSKTAPGVTITWVAFAAGEGGSVSVDFAAIRTCRDQWFGARLTFDDPAVKPEATVRAQIHESFESFRKECGAPPVAETAVMAGFGEAFAAAEKQVADAAAKARAAGNPM